MTTGADPAGATSSPAPIIVARDVTKRYRMGDQELLALDHVSLADHFVHPAGPQIRIIFGFSGWRGGRVGRRSRRRSRGTFT